MTGSVPVRLGEFMASPLVRGTARPIRLAPMAVMLLALAACGQNQNPANVPLDNYTASDIYKAGDQILSTGKHPKEALHYFQEVERLYPYTQWAQRALIMEVYTDHVTRQYDASAKAAQRYLDLYPGSGDAAYAQYLLALSYYDQIDEVGRDQGLTYQALQALRVVIEQYPDSDYAKSAILKFDLAFDHLAAKEMEIGRYYLRGGNYAAAINRFRSVVQDYQVTTQTPEALERLVESYLALGLTDEAQTAGAILGYNYRASPFYQDAFNLLKKKGLSPEARGTSWLSQIYRQMISGRVALAARRGPTHFRMDPGLQAG